MLAHQESQIITILQHIKAPGAQEIGLSPGRVTASKSHLRFYLYRRNTLKVLKYINDASTHNTSELEHRVQQLTELARALASEIETLQTALASDRNLDKSIVLDEEGIDFYREVERYEIELIESALAKCGGNQTQAARLLRMKSTTLNAKMKHYGINPVRSIELSRPAHP